MEIKNRQQVLLIAALVVIGLFVGDKVLLSPLMNLWSARSARIVQLRKHITEGRLLLQREGGIRARWAQMQRNTLTNNTSAAEQQFGYALDKWRQDSRVTINGITSQWKHDADEYITYQCRIDAAGSINALSRFLYDIEKEPLALKLESIELGAHDKEGQQLILGLQISGLVLNPQAK